MAVAERPVSTEERINTWARKISISILAALPGPVIAWFYFHTRFQGLVFADAMDYAQIARHLTEGHGFSTSFIRPLAAAVTGQAGIQPDLMRAPLQAVVTALLFGAMGARDEVAAFSSILFYLATIPVLYVLAARMFDTRVALLSAILYVTTERLVGFAVTGLPMSLTMFLVTLLFLVLYGKGSSEEAAPSRSRALGAGALTALCYLSEYTSLLFLIPAGIYLFATGGRARKSQLVFYLSAFLVVSGPWLIRNMLLTGNPFFTLSQYEIMMQTGPYTGYSLFRMLPAKIPSPIGFLFSHGMQMGRKLLMLSSLFYGQLPLVPGVLVGSFFIAGIFHSFGKRVGQIRWCFYGMAAVMMAGSLFMHGATEIFLAFVPMTIILAAAFLLEMLARTGIHRFYQNVMAGVFVFFAAYPLLLVFAVGGTPAPNPALASLEDIGRLVPKDQVIVTDIPWAVAWYSDRVAMWLPQSRIDYRRIDEKIKPLNIIYLSSMITSYPAEEGIGMWQQTYLQAKPPTGFQLVKFYKEQHMLFARPQVFQTAPASE